MKSKERYVLKNKIKESYSSLIKRGGQLATDFRTERALRTLICLIPAALFSYNKYINTNFEYSCLLLYVLMSSLIPPMVYGISIAGMMAFPAGIIGVSLVSLSWLLGTYEGGFGKKWNMYFVYIPAVMLISPWKIGKASALTGMGALMAIYSSFLPFFIGFDIILNGMKLRIPYDKLEQFANESSFWKNMNSKYENLLELTKSPLSSVVKTPSIKDILESPKFASIFKNNIIIPSDIKLISDSLSPLVGQKADIKFTEHFLRIKVSTGPWFITFAWTANGEFGIVRGILCYGGVALGLFILSLLIPPKRLFRSYFRKKVSTFCYKVSILLELILNNTDLNRVYPQYDKMSDIENNILGKNRNIVCTNKYKPYIDDHYTNNEIEMYKQFKDSSKYINSQAISEEHKDHNDSAIEDSLTLNSNKLKDKIKNIFPLSGMHYNDILYNIILTGRNDITVNVNYVYELLRREITSLEEMKQMVIVTGLEPSIANPGLTVFYTLKWPTIITVLLDTLIIYETVWNFTQYRKSTQLKNNRFYDKYYQYTIVPSAGILYSKIIDNEYEKISNIFNILHKMYRTMTIMISLRPVLEGSQIIVSSYFLDYISQLINDLSIEEKEFSEIVVKYSLFPSEKITKISFINVVGIYITTMELYSMLFKKPEQLAVAVKELIIQETKSQKFKGIVLNLASFCIPLLAMIGISLRTLFYLLRPWKWQWRSCLINGKNRYITTHVPWYNNTDILLCLKWSIGVLIVLAVSVFSDSYRLWYITNETNENITSYIDYTLPSKLPTWTALGYLTTFFGTVEGTIHRAALRIIGVLLGTLSGFLCLLIFGSTNLTAQIIWISITIFISCWVGGNRVSAILGYDPSWGYAAQLYCYQQCIIIIETYYKVGTRNELVLSRLVAQSFGISIAVILSIGLFPNFAGITLRQSSLQILSCMRNSIISISESLFLRNIDNALSNPHPQDIGIITKNKEKSKFSFYVDSFLQKFKFFNKIKYKINTDKEVINTHKICYNRSLKYLNDVKDALDKISITLKDSSIFSELKCYNVNKEWNESIKILQTLVFHFESMRNILPLGTIENIPGEADEKLQKILSIFNTFCLNLEEILEGNIRYFFSGYSYSNWATLFPFFKTTNKYLIKEKEKILNSIQEFILNTEKDISELIELSTMVYNILLENHNIIVSNEIDLDDKINHITTQFSVPLCNIQFLSMSCFLLIFIEDIYIYLRIIIQTL